jgi:hypothetical protein
VPTKGEMSMRLTRLWLLGTVATLIGTTACVNMPVGDLETESRSVKLGEAKTVRAEIRMGVGEMKLAGGARELLEADFAYNFARWKPEVEYSVSGARGLLALRQPEGFSGPTGRGHNRWDLRLNDKVPLELSVHLGVGKSELNLGTLALTKLRLETGVGETVVDLTGDWKNNLEAHIVGGVGKVTFRLPRDVGVEVRVKRGMGAIRAAELRNADGAYVNEAYGKSPVTLRINAEAGIGEINLELAETSPVI